MWPCTVSSGRFHSLWATAKENTIVVSQSGWRLSVIGSHSSSSGLAIRQFAARVSCLVRRRPAAVLMLPARISGPRAPATRSRFSASTRRPDYVAAANCVIARLGRSALMAVDRRLFIGVAVSVTLDRSSTTRVVAPSALAGGHWRSHADTQMVWFRASRAILSIDQLYSP